MMTDNDIMPFGKHKGSAMANVSAAYLHWFYHKVARTCQNDVILDYIRENLTVLEKEVAGD